MDACVHVTSVHMCGDWRILEIVLYSSQSYFLEVCFSMEALNLEPTPFWSPHPSTHIALGLKAHATVHSQFFVVVFCLFLEIGFLCAAIKSVLELSL